MVVRMINFVREREDAIVRSENHPIWESNHAIRPSPVTTRIFSLVDKLVIMKGQPYIPWKLRCTWTNTGSDQKAPVDPHAKSREP